MSEHYLLFRSAGCEFLLAMTQVVEVALIPATAQTGETHRAWRERVLSIRHLEADKSGHVSTAKKTHQIVVQGSDDIELLDVDDIIGLLQINEQQLIPFAPTSERTAAFVDRALPRPGGQCALRLRWP